MPPGDRERFVAAYRRLRQLEGWADETGREIPLQGSRRWRGRLRAARRAVRVLQRLGLGREALVLDAGSGGGWLRGEVPDTWRVIAVDLAVQGGTELSICGDMRALPLASGRLDAVMLLASLHYCEPGPVLAEAQRVLRPGGWLVISESPVYRTAAAAAEARARSAAYYRAHLSEELADRYFPLSASELSSALGSHGFTIEHFDRVPVDYGRWRRLLGAARFPLVVSRRGSPGARSQP